MLDQGERPQSLSKAALKFPIVGEARAPASQHLFPGYKETRPVMPAPNRASWR